MKQIRWAIIGVGDVVERRVANALQTAKGSVLQAAVRRNEDKLKAFAEKFGVPKAYTDVSQVWSDPDIDAVYIATPVVLHAEHVIEAARHGKHVLCEKPMAIKAEFCEEMIEACKEHNVKLGIAYYRRYYPKIRKLKELLDAGAIGQAVYARAQFSGKSDHAASERAWLLQPEISGGGALMDVGSHVLDLLCFSLGQPLQVTAITGNIVQDLKVEDTASLLVQFASGCQASVHASFSTSVGNQLEIFGTEGKLTMCSIEDAELEWTNGAGEVQRFELPKHPNMNVPMIEDFIEQLEGKSSYLCPGEAGILSSRIMSAAYLSAAEGRHVTI
ncbi:Gfo/Idh/MocA family protein [Paenibacillus radicis (ex Xue et al. 2023)]|uniref:Gfo/Idh/MocA family oxidoreductase n=1 Tax=Paenibacillus radicis (ex Xue et al. 2023) TaxID=2972489 RepID=A0ABT1YVB2_9BACL|nr:Gfo/Idh/MocA family oxidoreductase [Paenibacillus radicis (ex Xue et al. 2023)]MCR8636886.1 Gfo/Idh/MocA family oxidoreductase [Paenibacillus radicis (ex Xue et al. 2023)]